MRAFWDTVKSSFEVAETQKCDRCGMNFQHRQSLTYRHVMHLKNFSKHVDYIIEKNANICEKTMFLTIFVKKSFFFRSENIFDRVFFVEVFKKNEKWLYQMKVGIKLGKVKKFGIGWCIHHRMAADNTEGGSGQTPPPHGIGLRDAHPDGGLFKV